MMTTAEKLTALRRAMARRGLAAYLVLTDDFHASEYVGDYFKAREYLSGFTGSAGTLLVLAEEAYCRAALSSGQTGATFCRRRASWPAAVSS